LALPATRRIRDREHVRSVAKQPCLVCGRRPADAHHLRFAQSRALGRKVSDEFTIPLCRGHHREVHRSGDAFAPADVNEQRQCRSPRKRQNPADLALWLVQVMLRDVRHQLTFPSRIDHDRQISFIKQLICVLLNPNSASLAAGGEKIRVGRRNSFP
jgi:hypothetical protein